MNQLCLSVFFYLKEYLIKVAQNIYNSLIILCNECNDYPERQDYEEYYNLWFDLFD